MKKRGSLNRTTMQNKGLSNIITVVLIILIVIISISIIWVFVQPNIAKVLKKQLGKGIGVEKEKVGCLEFDLKAISCEKTDAGSYKVKVERGKGQADLEELKFKFQTESGEIITKSRTERMPKEYGFKSYVFNLGVQEEIKQMDVASIIDGNSCGFSKIPVICQDTGIPESECGDNICDENEDCPADCEGNEEQPWNNYLKTEYSFTNTFGTTSLPRMGPSTGIIRINVHMNNGCPYPPYGNTMLYECNQLATNELKENNIKAFVSTSMNSLWAGNNDVFLEAVDPAHPDFITRRDDLITRFANQENPAPIGEWDALRADVENAATGYGFNRIPGFGLKEIYKDHYRQFLTKIIGMFQVDGENYINYLQIDNEITVTNHFVGSPNEYLTELKLAREAVNEFQDYGTGPKTLLSSAGIHSIMPLNIENAFHPGEIPPDFVQRCSNGNELSRDDGATKKATWIDSKGYLLAMAVLSHTGDPDYNDVIDIHTYKTPYDAINYPEIMTNYLTNPEWGGPGISEDKVHIVSTEFDGADPRTDGRFLGMYCDLDHNRNWEYTNYNDFDYRIYQSEDLFMRSATGLFSGFEWGMRLRTDHHAKAFILMGLTSNRIDSEGNKLDPNFDTPSLYTYFNFDDFERNFFRGDKTSKKDYFWDDKYFLGMGFVDDSFLNEAGNNYYPAIIAWSRPENYPEKDLEILWNEYVSANQENQQIKSWDSQYIDFEKNEFKIFRPNYPLTSQYWEFDDNPNHVEIDKQIEIETSSTNLIVSESPRIFIFTQNPYTP